MISLMRRMLCLVLALLLCLPALAAAEGIGQTYKQFESSYAENIVFINDNTGRMLLPHSLVRDYDSSAKRFYYINSGALWMDMHMDDSGERIASCRVTLTAPADMSYGDVAYTDFATAGYHSYALLMAMDTAATAQERYSVVELINWGIKQHGGTFETTVGDYTVTCTSANGVATIVFECDMLMPRQEEEETTLPEIDITDDAAEEDENSLAG